MVHFTRLAAACALALAVTPALAASCFTAADKPTVPVYQQAPPPATDGQAYPFYPATVAATMQIDKLAASKSSVRGAYWQWANHGPRQTDHGAKGNITSNSPGVQIRFSTMDKADACTLAQTATVLGEDATAGLKGAGLTATTTAQTADTKDVCILPGAKLPAGDEVELDYEVGDNRTGPRTLSFLTKYAALVHRHGRKVVLYPDPLDGPAEPLTNLTAVAKQVAPLFDRVNVFLWGKNAQDDIGKSFAVQAAAYATTPDKLSITFALQGTTMADAVTARNLVTSGKAAAVNFFRNFAVQGNADCVHDDTNRKIACIALGRCG